MRLPPQEIVILGADVGAYALARAAHEKYGIRPIVVANMELGPIAHSSILEFRKIDSSFDEGALLDFLLALQGRYQDEPDSSKPLLLANNDWYIRFISDNSEELGAKYVFAVPPADLLEQVEDKARFAQLCADLNIPIPQGITVSFAQGPPQPDTEGFTFPLVAKATSSADWIGLDFPGKKKVYFVGSQNELETILHSVYAGGFRGEFLLQEVVWGDDTAKRSVTAYVNREGDISFLMGARVILEEHTPSGLGNPGAMVTGVEQNLLDYARQFLEGTNYRGFANFDAKIDSRTGEVKIIELNPRIGRNNYYVTAAEINPVEHTWLDVGAHQVVEEQSSSKVVLYSILPFPLISRYVSDPATLKSLQDLKGQGKMVNPLDYPKDRNFRRSAYRVIAGLNQYRKFRTNYPKLSDSGF